MSNSPTRLAILLGALALLGGCATGSGAPASAPNEVVATKFTPAFDKLAEGDYLAAEAELQRLARRAPNDPQLLINLGIVYARTERYEEAIGVLTRALEQRPDVAVTHNQLGIVYRKLGRFADAEAAYRAALNVDSGYALAHYNLGVLLDLYLGRHGEALDHYQTYLAKSGETDKKVQLWVKDLERRTDRGPSTAAAAGETERR